MRHTQLIKAVERCPQILPRAVEQYEALLQEVKPEASLEVSILGLWDGYMLLVKIRDAEVLDEGRLSFYRNFEQRLDNAIAAVID